MALTSGKQTLNAAILSGSLLAISENLYLRLVSLLAISKLLTKESTCGFISNHTKRDLAD